MSAPIELAVEVVEAHTRYSSRVPYLDYLNHANQIARTKALVEMKPYVDHVLTMLVNSGHLRRIHSAEGGISYAPTKTWSNRDSVLSGLRPPKPVVRAWRIRKAQARRAEKERIREERKAAEAKLRLERQTVYRAEAEARRALLVAQRGLTASGRLRRPPKPAKRARPVIQ